MKNELPALPKGWEWGNPPPNAIVRRTASAKWKLEGIVVDGGVVSITGDKGVPLEVLDIVVKALKP
jgi:hypothetical protein